MQVFRNVDAAIQGALAGLTSRLFNQLFERYVAVEHRCEPPETLGAGHAPGAARCRLATYHCPECRQAWALEVFDHKSARRGPLSKSVEALADGDRRHV
jgi:hypothetical protein